MTPHASIPGVLLTLPTPRPSPYQCRRPGESGDMMPTAGAGRRDRLTAISVVHPEQSWHCVTNSRIFADAFGTAVHYGDRGLKQHPGIRGAGQPIGGVP